MFTIQVRGLNELIQSNKLVMRMLERGEPDEELVKRIVRSAKRFAPRDTGKLVTSIDYEKIGKHKFKIVATAENERGDPYPLYLEIGTKYIRIGTPSNPRVYRTTSGKIAHLPYIGSAIWRSTTQKDIDAIAQMIVDIYK